MQKDTPNRRLTDQEFVDQEFTDRDLRMLVWNGVSRMARHVMRLANVHAGLSIALERLWLRQWLALGIEQGSQTLDAFRNLKALAGDAEDARGWTLL